MATTTTTDTDQTVEAAPAPPTTSRAVIRLVDAGNSAYCAHCGEPIKFRARVRAYQVICNVYVKSRWDRVEHYHEQCYYDAESPYGEPTE